jgi:RES domain-containing protein
MALTLYRVQKVKRWHGQPEPGFCKQGRWHSGGRAMLYLAESPALAVLEWIKSKISAGLVESEISAAELILVSLTLDLDPATLPSVIPVDLPEGWEQIPNIHSEATQKLGNAWLSSRKSLALRVPSATLPPGTGWNVLLNPGHPDYPAEFPAERVATIPFSLAYYVGFPKLDADG